MAGKPAEPRRANHAPAGERVDSKAAERANSQPGAHSTGGGDGDGGGEPGRVGPLTVERLRKPDGRALILYRDDRQDGRA
jgi:hypothetical protein